MLTQSHMITPRLSFVYIHGQLQVECFNFRLHHQYTRFSEKCQVVFLFSDKYIIISKENRSQFINVHIIQFSSLHKCVILCFTQTRHIFLSLRIPDPSESICKVSQGLRQQGVTGKVSQYACTFVAERAASTNNIVIPFWMLPLLFIIQKTMFIFSNIYFFYPPLPAISANN